MYEQLGAVRTSTDGTATTSDDTRDETPDSNRAPPRPADLAAITRRAELVDGGNG